MKYTDVRVGDDFYAPQNSRRAPISGKVVKVNRVNLTYETQYCPRPDYSETMTLTTFRADLIGGKVKRGETVEEVTE